MKQKDMEVKAENPEETGIIRNEQGKFVPGVSGNPAGRPVGSISIIAKIRKKFEEDPERFDEYVENVLKDDKLRSQIINHLDGAPKERKEVEVKLPQFMVDLIKDGITDETPN